MQKHSPLAMCRARCRHFDFLHAREIRVHAYASCRREGETLADPFCDNLSDLWGGENGFPPPPAVKARLP